MLLTRVEVADGVSLSVRQWSVAPDASSTGGASPGRESSAVPFLLVHGLSSNARLWDGVARSLVAAGHPAYAVDLRSHGESDAPEPGYDTATAAADLAVLIERLGLHRPVVAGQSWGGNVVVRLAARHPELVGALALVDGGWLDLSSQFPDRASAEAALLPPDIDGRGVSEIRDLIRAGHPAWSDEAVEVTLANLRVSPQGTVHRRLTVAHHMQIVRSLWDDPPGPDFPLLPVAVLLIPATPALLADGPAPTGATGKLSTVEKAAAALPRARIRAYPGGDHDLHAQYPEQIAADLLGLAAEV
jgi:pimeloyl-ACP methyl ester carboxylesterase